MLRKMQRQDHEVAAGTLSQQAAGREETGMELGYTTLRPWTSKLAQWVWASATPVPNDQS